MSDGGELRVERSLWRIVREAEIGREEREGLREKKGIHYRERVKKEIKLMRGERKIIIN